MNEPKESEPPVPATPPTPPAEVPASSQEAELPRSRPQYEFDESQNRVIDDLARAIVWVRVPLIIVGIFQAIIATGLAFRIPRDGAHIIGVLGHTLSAIVCFMLASWLLRAAMAFTRITKTKGRDISHLMTALGNLRAWFDLLAFFVKLYLALLAIVMIILLAGMFWGLFKEPPKPEVPQAPEDVKLVHVSRTIGGVEC
ncbi:MAG TPA: hypothetical protein VLM40_02690 [Gemmata sp.]|nr:hypothetical protein [Gemmata sp.]